MKEGSNMSSKLKSNVFLISAISVILLLLFLSLIFVVIVVAIIFYESGEDTEPGSYEYQYTYLDPNTQKISYGFSTIPNELKPGEFVSYQDEDGGVSLVSRFEDEDFKCSGTCKCRDGEDGRRAASVLGKGFFYLISALSSVVVVHVATSRFQEVCEDKYSDVCNNVLSEVDDCEEIRPVPMVERAKIPKSGYSKPGKHLCKGRCMDSHRDGHPEAIKLVKEFDCNKLEVEGVVEIEYYHGPQRATSYFASEFMIPFCRENSRVTYFNDKLGGNVELVCCAPATFTNPSIHCVPVEE